MKTIIELDRYKLWLLRQDKPVALAGLVLIGNATDETRQGMRDMMRPAVLLTDEQLNRLEQGETLDLTRTVEQVALEYGVIELRLAG